VPALGRAVSIMLTLGRAVSIMLTLGRAVIIMLHRVGAAQDYLVSPRLHCFSVVRILCQDSCILVEYPIPLSTFYGTGSAQDGLCEATIPLGLVVRVLHQDSLIPFESLIPLRFYKRAGAGCSSNSYADVGHRAVSSMSLTTSRVYPFSTPVGRSGVVCKTASTVDRIR
jgi:hypothetical protein